MTAVSASRLQPETLSLVLDLVRRWEDRWGAVSPHPSLALESDALGDFLERYVARLHDNYPFFHPRYAGQMLKPPHPVAVAGYLAAMLINPNNHALDGGPATGAMEKEVVADLLRMFGFPEDGLGHLTTSGTFANLEALWVARQLHPDKRILVSDQAHYTHSRMAGVLRMPIDVVPSDERGRMDLDALETALRKEDVGTVVATAGTTGLGAVDPIADLVPLLARYGVRLHVDAAYGGFFRTIAAADGALRDETARHLLAIAGADSVVVDPHKHGLQPYGCGCVLFREPAVGRLYKHDSPYTYFTSDELHLGEISLECSRAGAAAGALWLTLQAFPLATDGLGAIVAAGRRAAVRFYARIAGSTVLAPLLEPELDIVAYYPLPAAEFDASTIDRASQRLFESAMADPSDPVFLSVLRVPPRMLGRSAGEGDDVRVLRSVLMKPEHETAVDWLVMRLETLAHAAEASNGA
ncbi:MAG TPA: aminotransferase class I/II-fold pyridoxal phosphate-dependent enzyme [Rhodothermales bacterium]